MAESIATRLSADALKRGRTLITVVRKEAMALAHKSPVDVLTEAREHTAGAVRDLDARRQEVQGAVLGRLTGIVDRLIAAAGVAKADDVADLKRRVHELERRARTHKAA